MSKSTSKELPRVCCDSNVFMALFQGPKEPTRYRVCQRILEDARAGRIELFVSWSAVVECRKPPSVEAIQLGIVDKVEAFFENVYITKCDVDRNVAFKARELAQKAPRKLQTLDALQLATAVVYKVDYLFTYDGDDLIKLNNHAVTDGLTVCEPYRPWDEQMTLEDAEPAVDVPPRPKRAISFEDE